MENEVSTQPKNRITPQEYLELDRKSEMRNEYFDGQMFATREHIKIVANITMELGSQFLDRPCELYPTAMRTRVSETGLYTYPDIAVVCVEPQFEDAHFDTLLNPQLIIEVLSDSTKSYDRGRKFVHYRNIDSLREYVLVSQDECRIERFSRQDNGTWLYIETTDPQGSLELQSVTCRLSVARVYHKVDFDREKR
jgi:Uma2 family endonuclease